MTLQELIPESRIDRARLLVLVFGLLLVLAPLSQLDPGSSMLGLSVAALVAEIGILLGTALRGQHLTFLEAPVTAALAVLVGISLKEPQAATMVCIGVILTQTLYDREIRSSLLRAASFLPVLPLSAALSRTDAGAQVSWHSLNLVPPSIVVPIFLALVVILKGALDGQEKALTRARFLADTTGQLLAALNPQMVGGILARSTDGLCEVAPPMTVVAIQRGDRREPARVFKVHGTQGPAHPEEIPAEVLAPLDPLVPHELTELPFSSKTMSALGLPKGFTWYALAMGLPPEVSDSMGVDTLIWGFPMDFSERFMGVPGPGSTEVLELVRTVNRHGQVAFDAAVERMQLLEQTGVDSSSGLPSRETMVQRMLSSVEAENEPTGLVLVGFAGMREIILDHGLSGWGRVVRQIAERITAVQESLDPDAFTARLGDNVIAVVLPGSPDLISEVVDLLRERLAHPVLLDGTVIHPAITFGTAGPDDGARAMDLIGAATARMLSAPVEAAFSSGAGPAG